MFNSGPGVSKGNVILWKSRSALLPSLREVINVRTFTCPEKVFPSAHWRIPSDSEIALRVGQPEQQCMQGKTDEDGSHSNIRLFYVNIHEIMRCWEQIMFPTQAHLSRFQPFQLLLVNNSAVLSYNGTLKGSSNNVQ